jgi:hypothetical protein
VDRSAIPRAGRSVRHLSHSQVRSCHACGRAIAAHRSPDSSISRSPDSTQGWLPDSGHRPSPSSVVPVDCRQWRIPSVPGRYHLQPARRDHQGKRHRQPAWMVARGAERTQSTPATSHESHLPQVAGRWPAPGVGRLPRRRRGTNDTPLRPAAGSP